MRSISLPLNLIRALFVLGKTHREREYSSPDIPYEVDNVRRTEIKAVHEQQRGHCFVSSQIA